MTQTLDELFPGDHPVLLDGAMGTSLLAHGWDRSMPTAMANLVSPRLVLRIHSAHQEAGASVLLTNTFSLQRLERPRQAMAARAAVELARDAADGQAVVAGAVAGCELGASERELRGALESLLEAGVDLLVVETCVQVEQAAQAVALQRALGAPVPMVICASTTRGAREDRRRALDVVALARRAGEHGVEAGLNCGRGPTEALRLMEPQGEVVSWIKPNTGLGDDAADDDEMAAFARLASDRGARFIGGCCGTSPETLMAMSAALETRRTP